MKFLASVTLIAVLAAVLLRPKPSASPGDISVSAQPRSTAAASPAVPANLTVSSARAREHDAPVPREERLRQQAAHLAASDIRGALFWIKHLPAPDQAFAVESALTLVGQSDPAGAIALALAFQVGINDGRLEHFAQLWTEENPAEATAWIAAQPAGATRDRLLARSARVLAARDAVEAIRLVGLMSAGPARHAALDEVVQQWRLYDPPAATEALAQLAKTSRP